MRRILLVLALCFILFSAVSASAELTTKVTRGEYLYIQGSPARVNGESPGTYWRAGVILTDNGCLYDGVSVSYLGPSGVVTYSGLITERRDLHASPGRVVLTGSYPGLEIDFTVPRGYTGRLASSLWGNGTHLVGYAWVGYNRMNITWELPRSLAWRNGYLGGMFRVTELDLSGTSVTRVAGSCQPPQETTTTAEQNQAMAEPAGLKAAYEKVAGGGSASLLAAALLTALIAAIIAIARAR